MFNRIRDLLPKEKPRGRTTTTITTVTTSSSSSNPPDIPSTVIAIPSPRDVSPSRTVRSDESDYEGASSRRNLTPTRCPVSYTKIKALGKSMNIRTSQLIDVSAAATIHNVQKYVENAHRHPEVTYVILKYNTKQTNALLRILVEPSMLHKSYGCFITSKGNFPIVKENLDLIEVRIDDDRRSF